VDSVPAKDGHDGKAWKFRSASRRGESFKAGDWSRVKNETSVHIARPSRGCVASLGGWVFFTRRHPKACHQTPCCFTAKKKFLLLNTIADIPYPCLAR
jgi:hypothetical protein